MSTDCCISVIVPSFNSKKTIIKTIQGLLNQSTLSKYEIIVVDSSFDETPKIIKEYFPQVKIIHHQSRLSAGEARNRGIEAAKGKKILFTDADVIVPPNWIDRMEKMLDKCDIAGGAIENGTPYSFWGTIGYLLEWVRRFPGKGKLKNNFGHIAGPNSGYRKEVFKSHRFISGMGEEPILNFTLMKSGAKSVFDPTLSVIHINRTNIKEVLSYQFKLGISGYRWRKLSKAGNHLVLDFPFLMAIAPFLKLGHILHHHFFNKKWRQFFFSIFSSPILVFADYIWVAGFIRGKTLDKEAFKTAKIMGYV